jgi:hypothetical protein
MSPNRNIKTGLLAIAINLALSAFGASGSWAQQVVATVTNVTGSALRLRSKVSAVVVPAMTLVLNDTLLTDRGSGVTVRLSDNSSTIELGPSTTLVFDTNVVSGGVRQKTLVRLLTGGISSLIKTPLRFVGGSNFEVYTPNAVAGVRGTDFDTTYTEGTTRSSFAGCQRYTDVRVRDGIVAVTNISNPGAEVDVTAGYETTVPCLLSPLNAGPLGIAGAAGPGTARSGRGGGGAAAAVGFPAPPPGVGGAAAPQAPPPPAPMMPPPAHISLP